MNVREKDEERPEIEKDLKDSRAGEMVACWMCGVAGAKGGGDHGRLWMGGDPVVLLAKLGCQGKVWHGVGSSAWWVLTVEEDDARSPTEDRGGSRRDGAQPKRETARVCNRERGKRRRWGRLWVKGEDGS